LPGHRDAQRQSEAEEKTAKGERAAKCGGIHDRSLLTRVKEMAHKADDSAVIPENWTDSPIGYKNANAVPKRMSEARDAQ